MAATPAPAKPQPSGSLGIRWTYAILIVAFLFVFMPFLFWQATWFGKPLTDAEIEQNLANLERPRKTQHALSQIADRMIRHDPAVRRWYPQIAALGRNKVDEIRVTAAWVMGQDSAAQEFHPVLLRLLDDPHPMVQRNAALSLVRYGDRTGHGKILAMLQPQSIVSPWTGVLRQRLKTGDSVNPGTLLARVKTNEGEKEVRSQVPGTIQQWLRAEESSVREGEEIVTLAPSPEMAFEALRALVIVGDAEDLPQIERYSNSAGDLPESVRQQAALTTRSIRSRQPKL